MKFLLLATICLNFLVVVSCKTQDPSPYQEIYNSFKKNHVYFNSELVEILTRSTISYGAPNVTALSFTINKQASNVSCKYDYFVSFYKIGVMCVDSNLAANDESLEFGYYDCHTPDYKYDFDSTFKNSIIIKKIDTAANILILDIKVRFKKPNSYPMSLPEFMYVQKDSLVFPLVVI